VRPALDLPRLAAVAGAAVLTLVPGACSGGQQVRTSTTTTINKAVAGRACARLTNGDASRLFGEPAVTPAANVPRLVGAVSACFYDVNGTSGQLLQFRVYSDLQYYARSEHPDAQDVAGLGERAFVSRSGPSGLVDCQFVKQGSVYSLSYSNHTGDAAAKADALVELAREIAGRV
jgi:hypothetical protein